MAEENRKRDRFFTSLIILISVAGIAYFGIQAVLENNTRNQDNPFEYNIEHFKKSDSGLFTYTVIRKLEINLKDVSALASGRKNDIYVAGDMKILHLGEKGNLLDEIPTKKQVRALALDDKDQIYAASENELTLYSEIAIEGEHLVKPIQNALFTSVTVINNSVFLADAGNRRVWKFDKTGTIIDSIGPQIQAKGIPEFIIPSPFFDTAVGPDGSLWVVNPGNHLLISFTENGIYRSSWGHFAMETEGFSGCCNPSHIAVLSDGSFVTSEKGIPRVKVYNPAGILTAVVAGPDAFLEGTTGLDLAVDHLDRILVLDPKRKHVLWFTKQDIET